MALKATGVAGGLALAGAALAATEVRDLGAAIQRQVDAGLLLAVLALAASSVCFGWRWHAMVSAERRVTFARALRLHTLASWLNLVLPLRAGDGALLATAVRAWRVGPAFLAAVFVNERILNLVMMAALAFGMTLAVPALAPYRPVLAAVLVLALGGLGWGLRARGGRVRETPAPAAASIIQSFTSGLRLLTMQSVLARALTSSMAAWLFLWLGIYGLALGLNSGAAVAAGWAVLLFTNLASLVPLAPGNLGALQWGCIVALSFFGISPTEAVGFSVLLQAARIVSVGMLGGILWLAAIIQRRIPNASTGYV